MLGHLILNIKICMIFTRVFSKTELFLKNFSEFAGKHLSQSLFFNKIVGLAIGTDVLLWIYKFFKNNLFTKRLQVLQYYVLYYDEKRSGSYILFTY